MIIYDALKQDHEEILAMVDRLAEAESADARTQLIGELRDLLIPHSRAEEAVLYNTLREIDETKDVVAHGYQEHVQAEALLRGLQVSEALHLHWQAGVEKLKADLSHHIEEEQTEVFSAAKKVFTPDDARAIGQAFVELKAKSGTSVISSNVELMVNLMPPRFRMTFLDHLKGSPDKHVA